MQKKHKKKVIIFLSQPIDKRNATRFGYYSLKKNFDVKIYDLSSIFNSEIKRVYKKNLVKDLIDNKNFFELSNYFQIFKLFKECKESYFIDCTTYKSFFFGLLQRYAILNKSTKVHISNAIFPKKIHLSKREKLTNLLKEKGILSKSLIEFVFNYLKLRFINFLYPVAHFAFIAGLKEKNNYSKKTKIILSHSFDYDFFLKENRKKLLLKKNKFAIFIECIMFGHPELTIANIDSDKIEEKEKKYFSDLKVFFHNIYINLHIDIVIALHPRTNAHYKKKIKNFFHERYFKVVDNQTPKYIKNSSLVISHNSNAIQLAILWKKPIIFCHHGEMRTYIKKYILGLASELKKKSFDLGNDKFSNLKFFFGVTDSHYNSYIKNYIQSSKKSKRLSWDNFSDIFKD